MTYVILDDKFHMNQKVLEAGNEAIGVYARALSYCGDQLTDGFVPLSWCRSVTKKSVICRITEARLWRPVAKGETFTVEAGDETQVTVTAAAEGFYIDDYLLLNPRRDKVTQAREEVRRKRAEAGRKGAAARWQTQWQNDGKPMAKHMANGWQDDGPQPQPQPQLLKDSLQPQHQPKDPDLQERLIGALTDQTERTATTIRKLIATNHLADADIAWALECATGPGVISPTRVAVAELKKRAEAKRTAA